MSSRKNHDILEMYTIDEDDNLSGKNFDTLTVTSTEINFTPKIGKFGAPKCVCISSVAALIAFCFGMILFTTGICILIFWDQEPTIHPLGYTLMGIGIILFTMGSCMWISEFVCGNCFGKIYQKVREAPMKNAIKRREKIIASRMSQGSQARMINSRCGSRLSVNSLSSTSTISHNPKGISSNGDKKI
ncbi:Hypothetical protein SRAE_1000271000 [Strongyloides ratti]|uniref:Uncharacterized protein n=1 Tax=Strongyloides ratti TaxID=34506 RepID=A0A090L3R0_STRRB|nr:Hypothetical protein SRAE_1000271000 [Strongyloides ratti]CEF64456.1 Hypothetical protein SRAE_1000271000 [Strongyloides ratti]